MLILNLQPTRTLDYEGMTTGEWLANCSACCVPELAGAFTRARIPYNTVTGTLLEGDPAWDKIRDWVTAASAVQSLRSARFGFLGHNYPGMLDMYSDFTQLHAQAGMHVEVLEIDDLVERVEAADAAAIERKAVEIREHFSFADPGVDPIADEITPERFEWSARVAVGLDRLVEDFSLDGLTYYYRGVNENINERVGAGLIVGNSLLTARGIPTAGEADLKTNVAMFLMDRLGAGGSYTEFYGLDFDEGFVLMGHDGPGHVAISDQRPVLRALKLFHGKAGAGLSVEFKVQLGPVTILGMSQTADGRLKLHAAEGESIAGPTFRIGNTNSRIRFSKGPADFMDAWCAEGPTHHVALGVGHQLGQIRRLADLLDFELAVIDDGRAWSTMNRDGCWQGLVAGAPARAEQGYRRRGVGRLRACPCRRRAQAADTPPAHLAPMESIPNWSGYVATHQPGKKVKYKEVTGTWTVPKATCIKKQGASSSAVWVGIGGYKTTNQEEVGTNSNCSKKGKPVYFAWFELVPTSRTDLPEHQPQGRCRRHDHRHRDDPELPLREARGQEPDAELDFRRTINFSSQDTTTADWIMEAPATCVLYTCQEASLANFGSITMRNISAVGNGHKGTLSNPKWKVIPIRLVPTKLTIPDIDPTATATDHNGKKGVATSPAGATPGKYSSDGTSFAIKWIAVARKGV